jgi:hypothetical protein
VLGRGEGESNIPAMPKNGAYTGSKSEGADMLKVGGAVFRLGFGRTDGRWIGDARCLLLVL